MSTKCYEAYKYIGKPSDLIPTLLSWKKRCVERLTYCFHTILPKGEGFYDAWNLWNAKVKEYATSNVRNPFDFEMGVRLFQSKLRKTIIIVPHYERMNVMAKNAIAFLPKESLLKEFGYWDNSDKPDHLSEKEWAARAKAYGSINEPVYVSWIGYDSLYHAMPILGHNGEPFKFEELPTCPT